MTEKEWLVCESPYRMFQELGRTVSARKLRLYGIACCRRIWNLLPDDAQQAVELAERMAEGEASETEVGELRERMKALHLETYMTASESRESQVKFWARAAARGTLQDAESYEQKAPIRPGDADLLRVWSGAASAVGHSSSEDCPPELDAEHAAQAALLREVVGIPMRPVALDPAWWTPEVTALARDIYAESAFDRLPLLGKALRAAGCDVPEVLEHCAGAGPHVRGCWAVDQVLEQG